MRGTGIGNRQTQMMSSPSCPTSITIIVDQNVCPSTPKSNICSSHHIYALVQFRHAKNLFSISCNGDSPLALHGEEGSLRNPTRNPPSLIFPLSTHRSHNGRFRADHGEKLRFWKMKQKIQNQMGRGGSENLRNVGKGGSDNVSGMEFHIPPKS